MLHNLVVLAPPLCGARMLVNQLMEHYCYDPGSNCHPCGYDVSQSSYEDVQTTYLNASLFSWHKMQNTWNHDPAMNPFTFFLDMKVGQPLWRDATAAPVLLRMQQRQPWVRKDPQFVYVTPYWIKHVWKLPALLPKFLVLIRPPSDWVNAIFHRCVPGAWPSIPKDIDYFIGLWMDYMNHLLCLMRNADVAQRTMVMTLECLCDPAEQERLQKHLNSPSPIRFSALDISKVRHLSRMKGHVIGNQTAEVLWSYWIRILRESAPNTNGLVLPESHAVFSSILN